MKITEITEGWGEYSNKSNHRMNKFKRNEEVDEGEFGQWVSSKARAAGSAAVGAAGRQLGDIKNTALAKMGSGKAQGAKEMQRVVGGVIKNFNRYVGQSGGKPTVGALKQYLTALGIKNPVMEAVPAQAMLNKAKGVAALGGNKKQAPAQQAPATGGRKDTDVLTRNDLFDIIGKNIQQAMASGTLPKELKKFLGQ
jgi:hypothetical protein